MYLPYVTQYHQCHSVQSIHGLDCWTYELSGLWRSHVYTCPWRLLSSEPCRQRSLERMEAISRFVLTSRLGLVGLLRITLTLSHNIFLWNSPITSNTSCLERSRGDSILVFLIWKGDRRLCTPGSHLYKELI